MNYQMVSENSNSKLTKVWAAYRSAREITKLPLLAQNKLAKEKKSWIMYFNTCYALGLLSLEEVRKYKSYVIENKLQGKNLNLGGIKNVK